MTGGVVTELPRVPAERPLHAVLVRRVRESPWTLCSVALIAASLVATVVTRIETDEFYSLGAVGMWTWAGIVAGITAGSIGRRYHVAPSAPGDTGDPIRAAWSFGAPGDFVGPHDAEIHDVGDALRLTRFTREASDIALLGAGTVLGLVLGGGIGALAFPCLGWALGMPRRGRVWADVPWTAIRSWAVARGTHFSLRCRVPGLSDEIGLVAKFSQRERLTAALTQRAGARTHVTSRVPPGKQVPAREPTAAEIAARAQSLRKLKEEM